MGAAPVELFPQWESKDTTRTAGCCPIASSATADENTDARGSMRWYGGGGAGGRGAAGGSGLLVVWSGGRRRDDYISCHSPKEGGTGDPLNFGWYRSQSPQKRVVESIAVRVIGVTRLWTRNCTELLAVPVPGAG